MKDLMNLKSLEKAVLIDKDNEDLYFFEYFGANNEFKCIFPLGDYFLEGEDYTKLQIMNNYYHEEDFLAFSELKSSNREYILNVLNSQLLYLKKSKLNPVSKEYFKKVKRDIDNIIEDIFECMNIKNFILENVENKYKDFVIYDNCRNYKFPQIELFSISDITEDKKKFTANLLYYCNEITGEFSQHCDIENDLYEISIARNRFNKKPTMGNLEFACSFDALISYCKGYDLKFCAFEELDKNYQEKIVESINKRNAIFRENLNANISFLLRQGKITEL